MIQHPSDLLNVAPEQAGGKGRNLLRLQEAGFPVPPFTIIPFSLLREMMSPMHQQIRGIMASIQPDNPQSMISASGTIQACIGKAEIPEEIAGQIRAFTEQYASSAFAVRSSVSAEDQRETSFAGLFQTLLHVHPDAIPDAVRTVLSSLYSPEVMRYATVNRLDIMELSMAIVVQVMAGAEVSGILFTMNPTGNMSQMMLSAGYGYGDGVVNNTTDTATWLIDRQTGAIFRTGRPEHLNPLSTAQIDEVFTMALAIENHFGYPQDIEFSVTKGGEILILQSRDITTLDLESIRILDNTNIVESYPGITRPLTFTFAKRLYGQVFGGTVRYFHPSGTTFQTLREPLSEMIALVQGRVYYQLHNWYKIIGAVTPSGNQMHEWEQFIGIRSSVEPTDKKQSVRKLRMTLITLTLLVRYPAIMRRFYRRFEKTYRPVRQQTDRFLQELPDRQTIFRVYKAAELGLVQCWPATLLNDFFVFRIYAALQRMVNRISGGDDGDVIQGLLCGISGVESELPVVEMLKIKQYILEHPALEHLLGQSPDGVLKALDQDQHKELKIRFDRYISLYGDRTLEELKLEVSNFRQDREGFIRMLQSQLAGDNTLETFRGQQKQIREAAETVMVDHLRGRPLKRLAFHALLRFTKATVRNRENMRLRRTRAYGVVKELFLHAGTVMEIDGVIKAPQDVFMLDFEDLMQYLESGTGADLMGKATERAAFFTTYAQQEMPDRIIHQGDQIPMPEGIREQPATEGVLTGTGISKGRVTAEAIVLSNPDYDAPVDGKILVSRSTDPGWVFLMTRAAGIICEKGSPLSHTAIVGRELGIPVIVGVDSATRIIRSGDTITMDGERGEVEIHSSR